MNPIDFTRVQIGSKEANTSKSPPQRKKKRKKERNINVF